LKYVEKDVREVKVKRWRQKAVDEEERASVIKEAKALRRLYSQGVSRHTSTPLHFFMACMGISISIH
jgi:tRNA A-37 threonylcarbamoyl transferase component Bud32